MSDIEIAKRGEQILSLSFRRLNGRVKVIIKVHPSVEDLIRGWGQGISSSIYDFGGRDWIFSGPLPEVWDLSAPIPNLVSYGDGDYTLIRPGAALIEEGSSTDARGNPIQRRPIVNISFLRIVGISQGIEFELAGVHSVSYLRDVQNKIQQAVKRLYIDFLLPMDLTVQVNTQETRL